MPPHDEIAAILRALIERRQQVSDQIVRAQGAMRRADEIIFDVQARLALIREPGKYFRPEDS